MTTETYTFQALPRNTSDWVELASGVGDDETYLVWGQLARKSDTINVEGTMILTGEFIAFRFVEE